jgi:hypothetical protein
VKRPRSGGDDQARAAVARHEAAKQALPYPIKAALTLYDDGDWEDAALALVDECGLTDRQVKKGRKKPRELGLAVERKKARTDGCTTAPTGSGWPSCSVWTP